MPLPGWNPLAPVLQTVAAFSRHILIAPDAGPDDHRLRPLLALSLSPPSPAPPRPEVLNLKASRFFSVPAQMSSSVWFGLMGEVIREGFE
jgi:FAD-linked sulfhydryl oxidase